MIKQTLNYLRPVLEGNDGKPSIRRILAACFAAGIIRMVEHSYRTNCDLNNDVLITLCATMLCLLGLVTWSNLKEKFNGQTNTTENTTTTS